MNNILIYVRILCCFGVDMDYCIVYWSRYGHNKRIVEYIEQSLKKKKHSVQVFSTDDTDPSSIPDADMYVFSAPTEAFRVVRNMRSFMKKMNGFDGKKYGIINTHGMKKNWLGSMEKILSKKNMVKVVEAEFVIGKGQKTGEGLSDGWKEVLDGFVKTLK